MVILFVTVFILILSARARPPSTTVGEGANPFRVDKDVVFRTTYYFRVFDHCELKQTNGNEIVVVSLTDSLCRFRMTGKSKSIFSNVKFESGTLKAWEIDPFGVKVEFDKESKRFRVIPPHEVESDAQRAATLKIGSIKVFLQCSSAEGNACFQSFSRCEGNSQNLVMTRSCEGLEIFGGGRFTQKQQLCQSVDCDVSGCGSYGKIND